MSSINETITLLKTIILDENCKRMNKSEVKGYLGELIVLKKLQNEGFKLEHRGNQSGVDIIANNFLIDVKTSTLKDDGYGIDVWGWALKRKDKDVKFSTAICVALDEKLDVVRYYCIYRENVESFKSKHERLTNVISRFQKFPKSPVAASSKKFAEAYQKSEQLIHEGRVIEIRPDEPLGSVIK